MTIKLQRLRIDRKGLRKLLTSERMQAHLGERAGAMAEQVEAAGIRVEGQPGRIALPVTVTVTGRGNRARARVILDHPAGAAVEAKHGVLAASVDAAGDRP